MPPKQSTLSSFKPTKQELDAINKYLSQKPDFDKLIAEAKADPVKPTATEPETDYNRQISTAVKDSLAERRKSKTSA